MESRQMLRWVGVLMLAAAVAAALPWQYALDCDEGTYLTAGWMVSKGARIYADAVENKPPLLYWLAAFSARVSGGMGLLRLYGALLAALTVWSAWVVGERYFGRRAGALAAAFVALNPFFLAFWSRPLIHLVWVTGLCLLSLALIEMANRSGRRWGYAAAGVAFGAALLMKQMAMAILPALLLAAMWDRGESMPTRARRAVLFAAGALAALLPALAALCWQGTLSEFWLYCVRMHDASGLSDLWPRGRKLARFWLGQTLLLIPLAAFAGMWWRRAEAEAAPLRRGVWALGLWFMLSHAALFFPAQLGDHYLLPVLAPAAMMAAWFGSRISERLRGRTTGRIPAGRLALAALVCVALLAAAWPFLWWERKLRVLGRARGATLAQELEVGRQIAERTRPDDRILVVANPVFYFRARRSPPGKFFAATGAYEGPATVEEFRRALEEYVRSPQTRLVAVGAKYLQHPDFASESVNAIMPIIREQYRLAATLDYPYDGGVELWVRPTDAD